MANTEFELSDVEVDTIGLVSAGAIGEDFFLVKKDGDNMVKDVRNNTSNEVSTDVLEDIEVIDSDAKGFWDKMRSLLKGNVDKSESESSAKEDKNENEANDIQAVEKLEGKPKEVNSKMPDTGITKTEQPKNEDIVLQVKKALQEQYDTQLKDMKERLEKAEAEATRSKEDAAEKDMVQKARNFPALPIRYDELGHRLYQFSKSVSTEQFDWLLHLLTAVDKQLGASGILSEFGTSRAPEELALEDKVDSIAKDRKIDYANALLELSESEQKQLLAQMRK